MPTYEYRCKTCDDVFSLQRPMSQSSDPAACPAGHPESTKLLSRVMVMGNRSGGSPAPSMPMGGGGGCGSGCGCH